MPALWQVVAHERPDLQEQAASLSTQLASYTITLKELEDNLLQRLAASQVRHSVMQFRHAAYGPFISQALGRLVELLAPHCW